MTSPITPTIGWQPIETAPKDGTIILGYAGERTTAVEWYAYSPSSGEWQIAVPGEGYLDTTEIDPTHWMPLPAPPEALVRQEK